MHLHRSAFASSDASVQRPAPLSGALHQCLNASSRSLLKSSQFFERGFRYQQTVSPLQTLGAAVCDAVRVAECIIVCVAVCVTVCVAVCVALCVGNVCDTV